MELRASNMNRPLLGEAGTSITPGYSRNVSFDSTVQSDGTSKNNTRIAQLNVQNKQFMNNRISTSRYNWCNFIPKTVFMQFRRVANVYFLIMGILMWVGTNYPTLFTSPLSPGSTVGPLLVIIILTCIKEGLEDLKRHRSDGTTNGRKQCVLNPKSTATVAATATTLSDVEEIEDFNSWCEPTKNEKWKDVRVGQYVFVRDKEQMPADVVVLCSSNGDGCFIETSNIDGETNLKIREVPTKILDMVEQERKRLAPLGLWQGISDEGIVKSNEQTAIDILRSTNGTLEFEPPNRSIHTFVGTLKMALKDGGSSCRLNTVEDDMVTAPLSSRNFLLRGSTLKNTGWIIGVVVYTGFDTKIMQNSRSARTKMSRMEVLVNKCIRLVLVTQLIITIVSMCMALYVNYYLYQDPPWYLFPTRGSENSVDSMDNTVFPESVCLFITFFILFNNVVPISLYVTIEMVNFAQAHYIDNDIEMYDPETDTPALARTSSLNADLGQIEWIFSDKTGTLTCNEMKLRRCSVGGIIYGNTNDRGDFRSSKMSSILSKVGNGPSSRRSEELSDFWQCLSVCHTVVVEEEDVIFEKEDNDNERKQGETVTRPTRSTSARRLSQPSGLKKRVYRAESPDEGALVDGAATMGYCLMDRTNVLTKVKRIADNKMFQYSVLAINAFNSTRKRMSVLVKTDDDQYILWIKGADNVMIERASSSTQSDTITKHLSTFASDGLRTLVLGKKVIKKEDAEEWLNEYQFASESVDNRKEKLAQAAEKIEQNVDIIGITAIEDRLQDGVPDTIKDLLRAGIKLWVLTGDKVETAINIGFSSKLLKRETTLIRVDEGNDAAALKEQLRGLCKTFKALTSETSNSVMLQMMYRLNNTLSSLKNGLVTGVEKIFGIHGSSSHYRTESGRVISGDDDDSGKGELALVVTGEALEFILPDAHMSRMLMDLGRICDSVVACRVSPSQKANIIDMVHRLAKPDSETPPMTLAIGDGANDVGMIQEAQIGVGISGHEGLQAVNNSDFAIGQFRFMRRLLLVHGRWNYRRSAKVFLYSFFKNVVLVLTLFAYLPPSKISGQTLYESMVYAGYNFFLGWPIVGVGIFDRDISIPTVLKYPELYISGRLNLDLRTRKMFSWVIMAVVHSIFIYFIPLFTFTRIWNPKWDGANSTLVEWIDYSTSPDGSESGLYVLGTATYTCLIAAMHWKVMWHTYSWTIYTALFMLGFSIPLLALFMGIYSNWIEFSPQFYGVAYELYLKADLWLAVLLVLTCMSIVEYVKERLRLQFFPTATDIAMQLDRGFTAQQNRHQAVNMDDVETPNLGPSSYNDDNDDNLSPGNSQGRVSPISLDDVDRNGHLQDETKQGEGGAMRVPLTRSTSDLGHNYRRNSSGMYSSDQTDYRGNTSPVTTSYDHSLRVQSETEDSRRTMIATSTYGIDTESLDALGISQGRSRMASSFAFDAPSREIGRAIFDPSRQRRNINRRQSSYSRRSSRYSSISGAFPSSKEKISRHSRIGSHRSTRSNSASN